MNYTIEVSTKEERELVENGIVEYNRGQVPFTQETPFIGVYRVIKDEKGNILAGINSILYLWKCLYIDILWVKEDHREMGYGSILIKEVEKIAREKGCHLIHLDTFDFQAKDFYLKHGYEVFGVLEDCPPGHNRYYMKKKLL